METKELINFYFFFAISILCFSSTVAVLCGELPFDDSNLVTLYRKIQVFSNSNESVDQFIDPLIIYYSVLVLEHILACFVLAARHLPGAGVGECECARPAQPDAPGGAPAPHHSARDRRARLDHQRRAAPPSRLSSHLVPGTSAAFWLLCSAY